MTEKKIVLRIVIYLIIMAMGNTAFANEKPLNVVVFLVDDLRPDLGCYGNELIKSPNIDKLAEQGVKFNKAYCQEAICAPSRMSILTGLRPETFAIYDIFTRFKTTHPGALTLPQLYKDNGYKTVSIGKVYHHGIDDQSSWTTYHGKEANSYVIPGNTELKPAFEAGDVGDDAYKDGRATTHAIAALNQLKDDKFMMFVGLSKPHLPFNAPKKYWDLYDKNDFKIPVKQAPINAYSMALTSWGELRGYGNIPAEGVLSDSLTLELINGYYACVSYIDAQVGRVMKTLDDLGLRENTMVVFMSDHGWKLGEFGAWCKHSNFDIDINVPLIISRETSHADRKTNVTSDAIVENVDIFPTLAEACGIAIPERDGKSLVTLADNPAMEWINVAYGLYPRGTFVMGCTCTDGEYRYTEWRDYNTQSIKGVELYPCAENYMVRASNLAQNPQYSAVKDRMKALLLKQFPTSRPSFRIANMPDEIIITPDYLDFVTPRSNQEFDYAEAVKVEARIGEDVKSVVLKVDDVSLRVIDNDPYVWGVDSITDSDLFTLSSGVHTLTLIGLDDLDTIGQKTITIKVKLAPIEQGPYQGAAVSIPGRIEAENYDLGTEGLAYQDADDNNESGLYRTEGVDIMATEAGYSIDNAINDEWQEYTIKVEEEGVYDLLINYSSGRTSGYARIGFSLPDEGVEIVDNYKLFDTFSWDRFQVELIATGISLSKGEHILRSTVVQFGYYLDWIEIREQGSSAVEEVAENLVTIYPNPNSNGLYQINKLCAYEVYSVSGEKLTSGYGDQVDISSYSQGIYILQIENSTHKIVFDSF